MGATRAGGCVPEAAAQWVALERIIKLQLRRWIVDEDELADVTQDCLAKIWMKGGTFRGQSKFSSWLYRVVRNEFLSWVREQELHERAGREWSAEYALQPRRDLAEVTTDRLAATKLLGRLGELNRCILELYYLDDRTSTDIGRQLDLAASSVRCRIMRMRYDIEPEGLGGLPQ